MDGARLKFDAQKHIYIALNKPKQVLSTDKPHRTDKRQTVMDLIGADEHLFSIGRLDADSEGLVVMTNDGDLAQRLSHPRYRHTKTYRVDILGLPTAETLEKWQQGIFLEDGKTAPCFVEIVKGSVKRHNPADRHDRRQKAPDSPRGRAAWSSGQAADPHASRHVRARRSRAGTSGAN